MLELYRPASGFADNKRLVAGVAMALGAGLAYSSEGIVAKLLYAQTLEPLAVLTWRYFLSAIIFGCWSLIRSKPSRISPLELRSLIFQGLFKGTTVLLLFYAFMYIPAGLAVFLFYLYPTIITALEIIFLGVRPNLKRIAALGLTLVGLVVIAGQTLGGISWPGILCAIMAAFGNAVYLLLSDKSLTRLPMPVVSAATTAIAATALLAVDLITKTPLALSLTPTNIGLMSFLVLIPSVLALICLLGAVKLLGASRTSVIASAEPFFTSLLGFIVLQEHIGVHQFIGGVLIVLGVLLESNQS